MLGPFELLDKIVEFGKNKFENGESIIKMTDLWKYVVKIDPKARKENLSEVINELNARGWLSLCNETEIKFDPISFE